MILADTSVWIDFFRRGSAEFAAKLADAKIFTHPVVLGELATGNLRARSRTLTQLCALPRATPGTFEDCFRFLEQHHLHGIGLGWEDVQLLYSCLQFQIEFWTLDKCLGEAARKLGVNCKS